jgi:hypothetical protein
MLNSPRTLESVFGTTSAWERSLKDFAPGNIDRLQAVRWWRDDADLVRTKHTNHLWVGVNLGVVEHQYGFLIGPHADLCAIGNRICAR